MDVGMVLKVGSVLPSVSRTPQENTMGETVGFLMLVIPVVVAIVTLLGGMGMMMWIENRGALVGVVLYLLVAWLLILGGK